MLKVFYGEKKDMPKGSFDRVCQNIKDMVDIKKQKHNNRDANGFYARGL